MDLSGERRLPAARDVVWNALSDIGTLADSLPPGVTIADDGDGFELTLPDRGTTWRTHATLDRADAPAQAALHLAAPPGGGGFGGRAEITMAEDGVYTRLLWRISTDLAQSERPWVEAAIEHVLSHVGQRAATPTPVAAGGLASATAAVVNAASPSGAGERSPLQVILRTLAAMPRDSTIGGAVFLLVVLFVVGIL